MQWLIWEGVLLACLVATVLVARRYVRHRGAASHSSFRQARDQFRYEREWLEARFLSSLARLDPIERLRWEDASWQDQVIWARDRQTGRFLAFVGVRFDNNPFLDDTEPFGPLQATVLFYYARGHWRADGCTCLPATGPYEAFLSDRRYQAVGHEPHDRR